jgi:hypothetical protein
MSKPVWSWSSLFRRLGFNVSRRSGRKTPGHHKHRPLQFEPLEVRQFLSLNDLSGLTTAIIDDQATGYSEVGTGWQGCGPESGAYNSAFRYHAGGDGSSAAVYTFDSLDQGAVYQVFANWHESGNRASNSLFSVYDGNGPAPLGTYRANQKFAPDDAVLGNQNWESLGAYTIESGSIVVRLSDAAADGYVIADAVCIAELPASTELVTAIDDGDAAYSETGDWLGWSEETAAESDLRYCAAGDGSSYATFCFSNADPTKYYRVLATWSPSGNRSQESPFTILDGDNTLAVRHTNQQFAPDDTVLDSRAYESLGVYQATSGTLKVFLSNDVGSGYVVADRMKLQEVQPPEVAPTIIDDGDVGFFEHGDSLRGWSEPGALNGDFRYAGGGTGGNYADWQFADLSAGKYNVYVTWHGSGNRASNSLFSVMQDENVLASTRIDQTAQPSGTTIDGQTWQSIGQVTIEDGALDLRLSDSDANGFVIADGARIELVDLAPKIEKVEGGPNPGIENAFVNLRVAGAIDDGEIVSVKYYRDTNNDGILEPDVDQLLGTATSPENGWAMSFSTEGFGRGKQTFFAQATDDQGLKGNTASLSVAQDTIAVLDNSMPGYNEIGDGWTAASSESDYQGDHREHAPGGNATAIWTCEGLPAGNYSIFITYSAGAALASNAPFKIYDGTNIVGQANVDQRVAPHDANDLGAAWKKLGTFRINSGKIVVELATATADGIVAADAVRLYDPPFIYMDSSSGGIECLEGGEPNAFTVYLSETTDHDVTMNWEFVPAAGWDSGCPESGGFSGTLTIPANQSGGYIFVPSVLLDDDELIEFDDNYDLILFNPSGGTFDENAENYVSGGSIGPELIGLATIHDNDEGIFLNAFDPDEDNGYGEVVSIERNYSGVAENVAWYVLDGTATYGEDYWVEEEDGVEIVDSGSGGAWGYVYIDEESTSSTFSIGINSGSADTNFSLCAQGGQPKQVVIKQNTAEWTHIKNIMQWTGKYPNGDISKARAMYTLSNVEVWSADSIDWPIIGGGSMPQWGYTPIDWTRKAYIAANYDGQPTNAVQKAIALIHEGSHLARIRGLYTYLSQQHTEAEKTDRKLQVEARGWYDCMDYLIILYKKVDNDDPSPLLTQADKNNIITEYNRYLNMGLIQEVNNEIKVLSIPKIKQRLINGSQLGLTPNISNPGQVDFPK